MSPDTFYYHRYGISPYLNLTLFKDEIRKISVDFSAYCGSKSTSVSSSTFASEFSSAVSISGAALASNVASANFTALDEGQEFVTCTATLANGEKLIKKFVVQTDDPISSRYPLFDYAA